MCEILSVCLVLEIFGLYSRESLTLLHFEEQLPLQS